MFWVLRGKNLESQGNLKRLHCESVSQLHDCRLRVRLRTSGFRIQDSGILYLAHWPH